MNLYLMLAMIASALGPFLYSLISTNKGVSRFIDGLILMSLIGLITLHILPESLEHLGIATMAAVILGLIGPLFLSQVTKRKQCEIQKPFLVMTLLGFLAHNMLDGAALIVHPLEYKSTHLLALAVVIHRLLESMALWKTLIKSFSKGVSFLVLMGLMGTMAIGYVFSEQILTHLEADILHILQSLACGMLFHILLHPHHVKELLQEAKVSSLFIKIQFAGAFCGLLLAVLAYLYWPAHSHNEPFELSHEHHEQIKS